MDIKRKLEELLDGVRQHRMSPEDIEDQRVNFAFGNAPDGDKGTIDTVRAASAIMKQTKPAQ